MQQCYYCGDYCGGFCDDEPRVSEPTSLSKDIKVYRKDGKIFIEVPESKFLNSDEHKEEVLNEAVDNIKAMRTEGNEFRDLENLFYLTYLLANHIVEEKYENQ